MFQQIGCLPVALVVQANHGERGECLCTETPGVQLRNRLLKDGASASQVASIEMFSSTDDPTLRCVTAEADRQLDQFGGCSGGPAHPS